MYGPYPIKGVANAFLKRSFDDHKPLSAMKLQKLVFLAHGYHLAATGKPLVAEGFEAWQYGPVSTKLYHEFKGFGGNPITDEATELSAIIHGVEARIIGGAWNAVLRFGR